jgi:hypothetical protein
MVLEPDHLLEELALSEGGATFFVLLGGGTSAFARGKARLSLLSIHKLCLSFFLNNFK